MSAAQELPDEYDLRSSLRGSVVIVTGAAGGIGRSIVRAFAAHEAHVVAVDINRARTGAVIAELDDPDRHVSLGLDLSDISTHAAIVDAALERFGKIDTLVQLAAVLRRRDSIDDITEEDWDVQIDTNMKATFFLDRAIAQQLRLQGTGGSIINFASQGWWTGGFGGSVAYAASKGGVVSMSRGLARSLAPDGITVNTVAPGAVDTAMMRSGLTDEQLASHVAPIPLGRMAEPDEIAGTVLYLASSLARYVTGATLNVTGGWLMY